jgi:type II secretory pathway component PulJ
MQRRAFTLIEAVLCAALFSVLTGVLTLAWVKGSRAWRHSAKLSDRYSSLRLLRHRLELQLQSSTLLSLDAQPGAVAFASAHGLKVDHQADKFFRLAGGVDPQWRKHVVYFLQNTSLRMREIAVPTGHRAQRDGLPLSRMDHGSGPRPLTFYLDPAASEVLAENITGFTATEQNEGVVVSIELTQDGRRLQVASRTFPRN